MKKTIAIPKYMDTILRNIAKEENTTQSATIQHALTLYFLLYKANPDELSKIETNLIQGQTSIFDLLKNDKK